MLIVKNIPVVSVIIPTYNRARVLGRAIQSVLGQTYQDFEIIVVDDGSTDNTEELVMEIKNKDGRIKYIRHEKNKGAGAARNTGIKASNGKYLAFQDSDDEWLPDKLKKQILIFATAPAEVGVVYTDMWRISRNNKTYFEAPHITPDDNIIFKQALNYRLLNIGIVTALIKRECFDKAGMFDEKITRYIDLEFFIRASMHYYFYHMPKPLVNYINVDQGISSNVKALIKARKFILEKYYDYIKNDHNLLANHYLDIGTILHSNGELEEGDSYFAIAFRVCPNRKEAKKIISNHYIKIGMHLSSRGDFINGRPYLTKALKIRPLYIKFILLVFLSFMRQSFFNKIIESYRKIKGTVDHIQSSLHS